ncbi:MAG: WD40 repeat domain-containing protein [Candidatus Poribacteria bacterium]|nr:WD40 repeat domain-containing protein [Candidatus Poribacteria bacterium]
MKKIYLTLILISTCYLPTLFAETIGIPEAAVARLGKGRIYDVKYSPDGTRFAVATSAGIWLIDATTYKELAFLTQRGIAMHKRIVFSPDSRVVVSADKYESIANGLIQQWNVNNRWHPRGIRTSGEIYSLAFSPDGKTLVSGNDDIRFWDPQTRDLKMELQRPSEVKKWALISLAFSPDGKVLAGAFWKTICLWDTQTGEHIRTFEGHEKSVESLAFSADSSTLISGSWDGSIRFWDTQTGNQQHKLDIDIEDSIYYKVALSPDNSLFAVAGGSGTIGLFQTKTGERIQTFKGHSRAVMALTFSADMQTIASGSWDGSIRIWDVASGETTHILTDYYGEFSNIAVSADGKTIATAGKDKTLYLWDTTSFTLQKTLDISDIFLVNDLAFSPDGTTITAADNYLSVVLWDRETGELTHILSGHQLPIASIDYSPDGKTIVSGSEDYTIRLWDADTAKQKKIILGHEDGILNVAYSPDGKTIASSCSDTVRLWDVETGKERKNLSGPFASDPCFAFSPDSKMLATSGPRRTVYLWDVETGENIGYRAGYESMIETIISSIAFSPDGKLIATGARNGTVTVLDVDLDADDLTQHLHTFEKTHKSEGHRCWIADVAFISDGKVLLSRSRDGVVYLWDIVIKE